MNLNLFNKLYIELASFSFTYLPVPDIERDITIFEDGLRNSFEDRAQLTRVSKETNPTVPRFIFQNKSNKKLEVAVVKTTLSFQFKGQSTNKAKDIFDSNVKDIFTFLNKKEDIILESFVSNIQIRHPLKNIDEDIESKIRDKFMNIPFDCELTKPALSFGVSKRGLGFKYFIGSYDVIRHTITIDPKNNKNNFIKVSDKNGVLTEKGLSLGCVVKDEFDAQDIDNTEVTGRFKTVLKNSLDEISAISKKLFFSGE